MPTRGNAFTEARNVIINYTPEDTAIPIDAYKAVVRHVETIEAQYALNNASVVDLTAVSTPITGTHRFQLHVFNLTLDISAADYTFAYVETVPNHESIS